LVTPQINPAEWNKFVFNVRYEQPTYFFEFIVKNTIATMSGIGNTNVVNQHLQYIYFCHQDSANCNGVSIYWASGYYKNLRVWNGDLSSPWVLTQYQDYYGTLTKRTEAIFSHYTFNLIDIRGNIFRDNMDASRDVDYSVGANKPSWNEDNIAIFNYNSNFDFIEFTNRQGEYVASSTGNVANVFACGGNCDRCFAAGNGNCYVCATGNFLTESTCRANGVGSYFFSWPPIPDSPQQDITFSNWPASIFPAATITFWVKVFGFYSASAEILEYGTNLKLHYESGAVNYGLNLYYNPTGTPTLLSNIPDFRLSLGRWRFFSMAYYYDAAVNGFYPAMMKFEMNQFSFPVNTVLVNLDVMRFGIKSDFIGLIGSVKAYDKYIIGAYGIETNTFYGTPVPVDVYLTPGTNNSNCFTASDAPTFSDTPICKIDYDTYFDAAAICTATDQYFNHPGTNCIGCPNKPAVWGGGIACSTGCSGNILNANNFIETCFCQFDDNNIDNMIFDNGNSNICYRYDYINFARSQPITLSNVLTAKATEKYTMQFWIWAFNYSGTTWDGITFEWDYHNKIYIRKNAGAYLYRCSPFYQNGNVAFL